jgi:hypothetical protein
VSASTERQIDILRHALGLNRGKEAYRNHFVTGKGSSDYADCCALVETGLMVYRKGNELTGGDDLFQVTEAGRRVAEGVT